MLEPLKELLEAQYQAALSMLGACIARCPDDEWESPIGNLAISQVVFHTLFFTDVYLGRDLQSLKTQQFHRDHASFFRDYEELADRKQELLYDRSTCGLYLQHCLEKASLALAAETEESLNAACGYFSLTLSRAELHVYNIRHIQHHSAQLSLRLRLNSGDGVPWVGTGPKDLA